MILKSNVSLLGIRPEMLILISICESVYKSFSQELVLTSVCDGTHSTNSRHYLGCAIDTRTRYFDKEDIEKVATEIRNRIGSEFYLLVEKDHFHISFKPKRK